MLDPISLSFTTLTTGGFVPISTSLNPANSITCYNYEWNDNCSLTFCISSCIFSKNVEAAKEIKEILVFIIKNKKFMLNFIKKNRQ